MTATLTEPEHLRKCVVFTALIMRFDQLLRLRRKEIEPELTDRVYISDPEALDKTISVLQFEIEELRGEIESALAVAKQAQDATNGE